MEAPVEAKVTLQVEGYSDLSHEQTSEVTIFQYNFFLSLLQYAFYVVARYRKKLKKSLKAISIFILLFPHKDFFFKLRFLLATMAMVNGKHL